MAWGRSWLSSGGGKARIIWKKRKWKSLNRVWLFVTPCNSPGQNIGGGSLSLLHGIFPTQGLNPGLLHCRWILYQLSHKRKPKNIGVGSLSLLQWIFPAQESNRGLLHCRQILYQLSYQGSLRQPASWDVETSCTLLYVALFCCKTYDFLYSCFFIVGFASFECMCLLDFILPELLHRLWSLPLCPQVIDGNVAQ